MPAEHAASSQWRSARRTSLLTGFVCAADAYRLETMLKDQYFQLACERICIGAGEVMPRSIDDFRLEVCAQCVLVSSQRDANTVNVASVAPKRALLCELCVSALR